MTVKVRPFRGRKNEWECDIRFTWPDGEEVRQRLKAPMSSKSAALRWGQAREHDLIAAGKTSHTKRKEVREVPTLAAFAPRYIEEHCVAERLKPSTLHSKRQILDCYLLPVFGHVRLDKISDARVQKLKAKHKHLAPKTVNCVLNALSTMLRKAVEWGVLDELPCTIKLLKARKTEAGFYDFHELERLVEGARLVDVRAHLVVLLGGDAGLRVGEMLALEWPRVDLGRGVLKIAASEWRGQVSSPKGGRMREVPMTPRLATALREARHLRGPRVLWADGEQVLTRRLVSGWVKRAERRAGMEPTGRLHVLRHSFCSHLALRGAPAKAIQELAGHAELSTTMRYMHLSPSARQDAIDLLRRPEASAPKTDEGFGEMLEKA